MQSKHNSSSPKSPRSLPVALGLALLAATLVTTAGLPPDEQPKPEAQQPPPAPTVPPELEKMHAEELHHFATSPGFGRGRMDYLPRWSAVTLAGKRYQVVRPDLIALETKPTAYLNSGAESISMAVLTNKASKVHLPTRPITSEESLAITELRDGKDIVQQAGKTQIQPNGARSSVEVPVIRVVGAMRATAGCAKCHEVPQGTLLGAFSYTLVPADKISPSFPAVLGNVPTRPSP